MQELVVRTAHACKMNPKHRAKRPRPRTRCSHATQRWTILKLVFTAVASLLVQACDELSRFWSAELSGSVFVRTAAGQTQAQGGLDIQLVDATVRNEIESVQQQYEQRVKERASLESALAGAQQALDQEVDAWRSQR